VARGAEALGGATVVQAVPDVDAAVELLRAQALAGDVVLVKASRGSALERVAQGLTEVTA
jgi:UDP-N-acetylmuramyl pentapeptide synthase